MRILILAFLVWSPLAFAMDDFRCMADVAEPDGNYTLTFRGQFQEKGLPKMSMELLADNGFYGEFDPVITSYNLVEYQSLNMDAEIVGENTTTIQFRTTYDSAIGNYKGEATATEGAESMTVPVRCVFLRVI